MKANQQEYDIALAIYERSKEPVASVLEYANKLGIDEWSECNACDINTPDCQANTDTICLVCGSIK